MVLILEREGAQSAAPTITMKTYRRYVLSTEDRIVIVETLDGVFKRGRYLGKGGAFKLLPFRDKTLIRKVKRKGELVFDRKIPDRPKIILLIPERRRKIKMSDRDTGSSFAIGFIIGAVAGVAIGFLYAPKAGKETRALLKEKAEEVKEKAGEVTEKAKEAAAGAKKRVGEKFGHKEEAAS